MSDHPTTRPGGTGQIVTFIVAVALPLLSAGILINETMRVTVGTLVPMDAAFNLHLTRVLGTALVGLGFAASLAAGLDRASPARDRTFYRVFLLVNLALGMGWLLFWIYGHGPAQG